MIHNNYETPFYVRTVHGQTGNVDTLEEAMEIFTGEEGYRVSIMLPGMPEVVIRRDDEPSDELPWGNRYEASVEIRQGVENTLKPTLKVVQ